MSDHEANTRTTPAPALRAWPSSAGLRAHCSVYPSAGRAAAAGPASAARQAAIAAKAEAILVLVFHTKVRTYRARGVDGEPSPVRVIRVGRDPGRAGGRLIRRGG
jgi:hypothetical protein